MRIRQYSALILLVLASAVSVSGQPAQGDAPKPFYFVALTDPACPVSGYVDPVPTTKEIRVLYFPMGQGATIKDPKSLVLHLVFDDGGFDPNGEQTFPFRRREDGVWLATVELKEVIPQYAIYWVEDRASKQVDTNGGKYFEVPFCDVEGRRDEQSVMFEAESYTGKLAPQGIERPPDYARAIDVLEEHIHPPSRGQGLISSLWRYKLKLGGDTPEIRAGLVAEINKFISDHSSDGFGLTGALDFAVRQDWVPSATTEILVKAVENTHPKFNARAFVLQAQASREKDKAKQIAIRWEIVEKYPASREADFARKQLLSKVKDVSQREKLYLQLRASHPDDASLPLNMAAMYVQANQKLPEALALLDEADGLFAGNAQNKRATIHYPESTLKFEKRYVATMRAEILLRSGQPGEALSILQPLRGVFTDGHAYYLLGRALEDTGDRRSAIDAYLEAVVRPSTDDEKANAALEGLWLREKAGDQKELEQRIEAKLTQNFSSANYVPRVVGHHAPDFDLITLHGEHLTNSELRGKKVILDFWAVWCGPCRPELKPLQDFQEKHPEVVVATVFHPSANAKQLDEVIQERKLTSLRIAKGSPELWEKFGVVGVPSTFVIDESGYVRIQHTEPLPDVSRYLEADLKAIAESGPAKEAPRAAR